MFTITDQIREKITQAIQTEKEHGFLADKLRQAAEARKIEIVEDDLNSLFMFIQDYIEHVPALLEGILVVAKGLKLLDKVSPLVQAAQKYFLAESDMIPDRLGLLGLLDDAYVAHQLLQKISDEQVRKTGKPLLPSDMTRANEIIRDIIGEPHASLLDAGVADEFEQPAIKESLLTLLDTSADFRLTGPDPIWGEEDIHEILIDQAGAWGIS